MTNLLFSLLVTCVTNVTETDNAEVFHELRAMPNPPPGVMAVVMQSKRPATERVRRSEVWWVTNAVHEGKLFEVNRAPAFVLSETLKAKTDWESMGVRSNGLPVPIALAVAVTNHISEPTPEAGK